MLVADWLARFLAERGVQAVYEVVGGMVVNLIDALHRDGRVQIVSCHHEQAAGFAAEGSARVTGVPGIAMATSGPGAINLLTALGSCYFDSTPAVFITGQVNRAEQKGSRPLRQLGFQETDVVSMAAPIAKAAWRVRSGEEVPSVLASAFELACAGRPGPVLVDLPFDVQRADVAGAELAAAPKPPGAAADVAADVGDFLDDLSRAERPLILAGGGLRVARAVPQFRSVVAELGVPVVHSLMGVDLLASDDPLRVGMVGTYGNRWANMALARADLVLVLGSRLDIRQTGSDTAAFAAGKTIYHVDIDPAEINNRVVGCRAVVAALPAVLSVLHEGVCRSGQRVEWLDEIDELARRWPDTAELADVAGINPNVLMHSLSRRATVAAYVTDVGQHQMWAAQSLELTDAQRFITSGGMGAMGSGLPLAIGVCQAVGQPVALIAGDGGFQLNLQELQTVVRNRLPLRLVILNNGCHGMVRQFQDSYFEGRYRSTMWGYSAPPFVALAQAYGIPARRVEAADALAPAIADMYAADGPHLLEVAIDTYANVYPKIAFGRPISEMEPFAAPKALEPT
jgi:acetolactate synthase-1/2/3 large subunit